ncbi:hypothetical protein D0817_21550 [Flavobacterium cupreum]|uniref:Uncharacterized protein n=1 Tax=Flavobacterium cupreum TaxID=2133766 RepID=A0A434A1R8_9FLAO|nr:hypothetical protein D0817_21550 [Flavobacterium cupreum]
MFSILSFKLSTALAGGIKLALKLALAKILPFLAKVTILISYLLHPAKAGRYSLLFLFFCHRL